MKWMQWLRSGFREQLIEHRPYELWIARGLCALVAYDSINWTRDFDEQKKPNGLANWFDLTAFGDLEFLAFLRIAIIVPLVLFALGLFPVLSLVCVLFVTVGVGTLNNSQGAIDHSTQIVSLILLAQLVSYLVSALKSEKRVGEMLRPGHGAHNLAMHYSKVMIAAGYVVSGCMKLINSDGLWLYKVPLISVQITKANLRDYSNTLVEKTDFVATRIPELILEHPNLARIFFGGGLFLELLGFLALLGRRWAFCTGVALIMMHFMIGKIMALHFELHMYVVAIFFVNLPGIVFLVSRKRLSSPSVGQ